MPSITQAHSMINEQGIPITRPTLYMWVRKGVLIDSKPLNLGLYSGTHWLINHDALGALITALKKGKKIEFENKISTPDPNESRGRKKGSVFGKYRGRPVTPNGK